MRAVDIAHRQQADSRLALNLDPFRTEAEQH